MSTASQSFKVRIVAPGAELPSLDLIPKESGSNVPFMAGIVLQQGAAPAGTSLVTTLPETQVLIQNTWPNGSARHVVIAGRLALATQDAPVTLRLELGAHSGAPVPTSAIDAIAGQVQIELDLFELTCHSWYCKTPSPANAQGGLDAGSIVQLASGDSTWAPVEGVDNLMWWRNYSVVRGPLRVEAGPDTSKVSLLEPVTRPPSEVWIGTAGASVVAKLSDADQVTPLWQGPEASYFKYVATRPLGATQLRVEWYVRVHVDGQIEITPRLLSGGARTPGCRAVSYRGRLRIDGEVRVAAHQYHPSDGTLLSDTFLHFPHTALNWDSHCYVRQPAVWLKHDVQYLRATKMVPNYSRAPRSSRAWDVQPNGNNTLVGLGKGGYAVGMNFWNREPAYGGWRDDIGLLPRQDALYITSDADEQAWNAMICGARSHWSWPTTMLDEGDGFGHLDPTSAYWRTRGLEAKTVEGYLDVWGGDPMPYNRSYCYPASPAHFGAAGYLPYLLTGRRDFLESILDLNDGMFVTGWPARRGYDKVYYLNIWARQERSWAWFMRNLALVAVALPDSEGDAKTRAATIFATNVAIRGPAVFPSRHPLGILPLTAQDMGSHQPAGDTHAGYPTLQPLWEYPYTPMTLGLASDLQFLPTVDQAALVALRDEAYKFIVGTVGDGVSGWPYVHLTEGYGVYAGTPDDPAYSGTSASASVVPPGGDAVGMFATDGLFTTWEQIWGANSGFYGGPTIAMRTWYWLPALSYAVDHGAPGARAAYDTLTSDPGWPEASGDGEPNPTLYTGVWNPWADLYDCPIWSIAPRS